jgi:hypothetical protein
MTEIKGLTYSFCIMICICECFIKQLFFLFGNVMQIKLNT